MLVCVTALCEACRARRTAGGLLSQVAELPHKVTSYLRMPYTQSVETASSLAHR